MTKDKTGDIQIIAKDRQVGIQQIYVPSFLPKYSPVISTVRIAVPVATFENGAFTRGPERTNIGGRGLLQNVQRGAAAGGGAHGGQGGGAHGGHGGHGVSTRNGFEFSSWPTPSSHCSQSMAEAAKEKVEFLWSPKLVG